MSDQLEYNDLKISFILDGEEVANTALRGPIFDESQKN
jgi:hypothetical protein